MDLNIAQEHNTSIIGTVLQACWNNRQNSEHKRIANFLHNYWSKPNHGMGIGHASYLAAPKASIQVGNNYRVESFSG